MDTKPFIDAYQELNTSFIKLVDSMSALRELSALRIRGQSDRALLEQALQVLMHNQDLERCSVYLPEGDRLVNRAGMSWAQLVSGDVDAVTGLAEPPHGFALGEGIVGRAAASGQLQHCDGCGAQRSDSEQCRGCDPLSVVGGREFEHGGVDSLLSVPILATGEVIGVLNVAHPHAGFFTESHKRTLLVFSNFLGQLLMSNRLLSRMNELVHERTQQLESALNEAEELKRKYAELSVIDELTSLHNRRFFFPEARAALARALRYRKPMSMVVMDIDHFKQLNDNHGHAFGDEVLRRVGPMIREKTREADVLARFGGEEFIIALPDTDLEGARTLAERIRVRIGSEQWECNGKVFPITVSVGISVLSADARGDSGEVLEQLVQEADQAMYFGKHHGRNQCRVYTEIACEL